MFEKLKKRWNIDTNFQVIIILIVFAITGSTTVYVKQFIFDLIGISTTTPLLIKIPLYVVVILPVYNLLLLAYGFLFGQFQFFKNFIIKFFGRFRFSKKVKSRVNL
jgi:hypothetical protein